MAIEATDCSVVDGCDQWAHSWPVLVRCGGGLLTGSRSLGQWGAVFEVRRVGSLTDHAPTKPAQESGGVALLAFIEVLLADGDTWTQRRALPPVLGHRVGLCR